MKILELSNHWKIVQAAHRWWAKDREKRSHHLSFTPVLDMRLLGVALLLWGATFCFFAWGTAAILLIILLIIIFIVILIFLTVKLPTVKLFFPIQSHAILALILITFQLFLCWGRGVVYSEQIIAQNLGKTATYEATIHRVQPLPTGSFLTTLNLTQVDASEKSYPLVREATTFLDVSYTPGSTVQLRGRITKENTRLTLTTYNANIISSTNPRKVDSLKQSLREKSVQRIGENPTALLLGMSYGDDSTMDETTRKNFQISGLTHLTAVSGSNITLIFLCCYRTFQTLRFPRLLNIMLCASGTLAYSTLVGWEGSVLRAWLMGTIAAYTLCRGAGQSSLSHCGVCVITLLVIKPELCENIGFMLSVVATVSILIIAPALTRICGIIFPLFIAELLSVSIAATLWTTPLIIIISDRSNSYSVLANLLATFLVAPITILGLLLLSSSALKINILGETIMDLALFPVKIMLVIAQKISALPGSSFSIDSNPLTISLWTLGILHFTGILLWIDHKIFAQSEDY